MITSKRRGRMLARIAAAFLLTSSITSATVSVAYARQYTQQQQENAFWNAGYSYCDAEKLGQYWQMSTYNAKLNAGYKILIGDQGNLNQAIETAIQYYGCPNGFNFDDATNVAELWTAIPSG